MKILWLSTGDMNCEPIIGSLEGHEILVHNYVLDANIVDAVKTHKPDTVLYISVSGGAHLPKVESFKAIQKLTKLIHICFDAGCSGWIPLLTEYRKEGCFDRTVSIDGSFNWPMGPNDMTILAPINPKPFIDNITEKTIDAGFCGGWASSPRKEIIEYLQSKSLITVRTRVDTYYTYNEYAKFMNQCKIVLNMCKTGGGSTHVKARVIETGLAAACLIEEKGFAIKEWFVPGLHYIEYQTKEEAADIIQNLIKRPHLALKYAISLSDKIRNEYSPKIFWHKVLS